MMKRWSAGGALLSFLAVSVGCDAFLGLDDKPFGTTTTITLTGGGGSGGTTSSGGRTGGGGGASTGGAAMGGSGGGITGGAAMGGGGSGGGITGGAAMGGGGSGGGITGGTGGAVTCLDGVVDGRVEDELDFPLCPESDTAMTLKARGWTVAWQEENYPVPPVSLNMSNGSLRVAVAHSVYWFDGETGPFIEKTITGDFLLVADVKLSKGSDPGSLPTCSQAGAGILVRDPASVGAPLERWVAVDRGANVGVANIHGSWSNGTGVPNQDSVPTPGLASGKIAICRSAGVFHIYSKTGNSWTPQDALLPNAPQILGQVQAGVFIYAYDNPKIDIPTGVAGAFNYIHQHDLIGGACDPGVYGE